MRNNILVSAQQIVDRWHGQRIRQLRRLDPVFQAVAATADPAGPQGVTVARIAADETPGKRVYSPGHPDADPEGFVTMPNVNPVHEVVNLLSASRGYEANTTAVETLKQMAARALEILR